MTIQRRRAASPHPVRLGVLALGVLGWLAWVRPGAGQELAIVDTVCDVDFPTCADGIQGLRGARSVAVSPDGAQLYVVSSLDDALLAFSIHPASGELTHLQTLFDTDAGIDGLDSARGVALSPDGAHVYVAALLDSSVATFARSAATGMLSFVETDRDGMAGVDGIGGAHGVAVSPDGAHVYVTGRSDDAVAVFARNPATGALTFVEAEFDGAGAVDGLDGAEAVTVSPDGAHVVVAGETDNAVVVFARETDSGSPGFGELTYLESQFDEVGGVDGLHGVGALAFDPTGINLYAASLRGNLGGIGGDDWIAVFAREPGSGALSFVQALDENDFDIFAGCTGVGNENSGVAVSADGEAVYLTNPFFGTVAWFSRSPGVGALLLEEWICDESFGADGIAGAVGVAVTPDGRSVLTASPAFETVAVLRVEGLFSDGFESGDTSAWSGSDP